jgi:acyl-CoA dehydrogenase
VEPVPADSISVRRGLSNLEYAPLCEIMGRVSWAPGGVQLLGARHRQHGDARALRHREQKKQWLEPLLAGEIRSAFAMTEPAVASSDATNIQCEIERDGDEYVINGRKWWTSGAGDPRCKIIHRHGQDRPDAARTSSSR